MNTSSTASSNMPPHTSAARSGTLMPEDVFARKLAARLSAGTGDLPHDVAERLRVSRARAVSRRRQPGRSPVAVGASGGTALLGSIWWTRLGALVPLVALVAGLLAIHAVQDDDRVSELADVDSALLADDLPPTAYADPGFAQFLKNGASGR